MYSLPVIMCSSVSQWTIILPFLFNSNPATTELCQIVLNHCLYNKWACHVSKSIWSADSCAISLRCSYSLELSQWCQLLPWLTLELCQAFLKTLKCQLPSHTFDLIKMKLLLLEPYKQPVLFQLTPLYQSASKISFSRIKTMEMGTL